jgi:HK97 family phage major capsid protein
MKHLNPNAVIPLETRSEPEGLEAATRAVADLAAAFETRMAGLEDIENRLSELETRGQRPGATSGNETPIERRAFTSFIRHGRETMEAEEVRSLVVGDDSKGGYLAPAEFVAEVIKNIVEISPVRQAARVGNTSAGSVVLPKRTGKPTAAWVGETDSRSSTQSTYGQSTIPVNEAAAYVDVSNALLEDSAVNVDAELAFDLAEEFGRLEGAAFVNGDGAGKPEGFMSNADIGYSANGHATTLGADALITLMYSMPAFYRNNGVWMMNGSTLATVRKLKTTSTNDYLWQPSYQAGQPETLLGRPVIEAADMPDIASGTFPIAFGDFGRAYRIYDRLQLAVLRDPYSVQTSGLVRFHARRRTGGGVVLAEAIKKLKMATS